MSYTTLNIENWDRKEHFKFFKTFDEPFFGVTFNIDVTKGRAIAKENQASFFIYYLYAAIKAANSIENFRYRIHGEEVRVYDGINASPTINRPDGTFGFSYINFTQDFKVFYQRAQAEISRVQADNSLVPSSDDDNTIHFSAIPWIHFTSLSHARKYGVYDSVPKISFGKIIEQDNKMLMPTSVHVHHALMDGYHVGLFAERFQENINSNQLITVSKSNEI